MNKILTQEEVDALLRGISGGEIETEMDEIHDPSDVVPYDLTSQDRIIRGRMPTLEMINEKFARLLRTTLSSLLRKVTSVSAISVNMVKFGEFLKTLPVPTSMHLFRMDPLRGTSLFVVEAKVIFMLVDILFGGSGRDMFKVEGREFTAIENNIIRRVVLNALADLEKAWRGLIELKMEYQRSEVNPQFVYIVSPTDVVVVVNFEVEVEYSSGLMTLCIPYATLEPLREKLQAGFQSEQMEVDRGLMERFRKNILQAEVDLVVELGSTQIAAGDVVNFQVGDIIPLDQYAADPVRIFVEGIMKFDGYAGVYRGSQAVQIAQIIRQEGE
ncbi:MAG TPA: flagellar motor switch protein FliM [Syntrophales bacterium]|jgi:flagellar motor switch protein FliM|nr:flagellar motor switch protein FliM [Syntrophales bacterium]HON24201.1 flagellar motor switch protein FliM [Syntrophales bacterium]HOU77078.1 flagellar motor switch protein FliM [Syntrophales bacterium]HPC33122.1 flagellar motor switch protein FliM [Syntrophales bacterium]HQG35338.1 flagellar motor switch protein FliM [Syntrophales bacterium]